MLTVCPTPIGNLDDVTARQRRALAEADVVACEDTRRTGKLLEHLGIDREDGRPRLVAYHEHNESEAAERLVKALRRGDDVTLVSDAGTPAISDPGFAIIRRVADADLPMTALPGPVAAIVALTGAGLPTDAFQFRGYPPAKATKRRSFLDAIEVPGVTTLLYESPHRIEELLADLVEVVGAERRVCVARELTKMHEEYLRGTAEEVYRTLCEREETRGEFVVVVAPPPDEADAGGVDEAAVAAKIRDLLDRGFSAKSIKEIIPEIYDVARSEMYDRIEDVKEDG